MKIFIDTNIFFNNWMLRGAHFQLLSNYIKNTGNQLIIPEVVNKEVENKFKVEFGKIKNEIINLASKVGQFTQSSFEIDMKQLPAEEYDFKNILLSYYPNTEIITIDNVDNKILVEKAIHGKRPFRESEKGYRDAVIWHSLINYIKDNEIDDEIALITCNSNDFFVKDGENFKLHKDLEEDLYALVIGNTFTIHNSLKSFIISNVNEALHEFSHHDTSEIIERYGESIEEQFEYSSVSYINNLPLSDLAGIYSSSGLDCQLLSLFKSFTFEFLEGTEDPDLYNLYKISEDKLAFEYSFNLRGCAIEYTLNTSDYMTNKKSIDAQFFNAETEGFHTKVFSYPRTYFVSSGVLNLVDGDIEQVSFDEVYIR